MRSTHPAHQDEGMGECVRCFPIAVLDLHPCLVSCTVHLPEKPVEESVPGKGSVCSLKVVCFVQGVSSHSAIVVVERLVKGLEHSPSKDTEGAEDHGVDGNRLHGILDTVDDTNDHGAKCLEEKEETEDLEKLRGDAERNEGEGNVQDMIAALHRPVWNFVVVKLFRN